LFCLLSYLSRKLCEKSLEYIEQGTLLKNMEIIQRDKKSARGMGRDMQELSCAYNSKGIEKRKRGDI
jgi:hypothetical protein